jgi:hypothetical protein
VALKPPLVLLFAWENDVRGAIDRHGSGLGALGLRAT